MPVPDSPNPGDGHIVSEPPSPVIPSAPGIPYSPVQPANPGISPALGKAIDDVLQSEIGVSTLLGRLKQCVATAKELATFFKNLAKAEDTKAKDLKHLARATQTHRAEARSGSYGQQFEQVALLHERMANNSIQFSLNLSQMQDDLLNLANEKERERKQWKQTGLSAETRVQDAESTMEKAKNRYNSLAEDYDHARTGDKSSRKLNLRSIGKSNDQREEDLHQRVKAADEDYQSKVENAQQMRQELISSLRPQTIRALQHLIEECDSALTMQLQKFAGYSEQTLLKNGLLLVPGPDVPGQRSLRDIVAQIDNESDLRAHVLSFSGKVPPQPREIKYEQHPALRTGSQTIVPPQSTYDSSSVSSTMRPSNTQPPTYLQEPGAPTQPSSFQGPPIHSSVGQGPPSQGPMSPTGPPSQAPYNPISQSHPTQPAHVMPPVLPTPDFQRFDGGFGAPSPDRERAQHSPTYQQPTFSASSNGFGQSSFAAAPLQQSSFPTAGSTALPPQGGLPRVPGDHEGRPTTREGAIRAPGSSSPSRRMFGLSLNDMFDRDKTPVPLVLIQCIQAVDHFGLDTEGIYRVSGNQNHVGQLRNLFDNDAQRVDLRNPEIFFHDVHVPANLLKMFFRELPDPLLTKSRYDDLIQAARIEDDIIRRDNLHAIINDLPDPNYATLRALVLHLHRIESHSSTNRMTPTNLAVIFGPTLMGAHSGDMTLASLQPKVIQTILTNALQIFDED